MYGLAQDVANDGTMPIGEQRIAHNRGVGRPVSDPARVLTARGTGGGEISSGRWACSSDMIGAAETLGSRRLEIGSFSSSAPSGTTIAGGGFGAALPPLASKKRSPPIRLRLKPSLTMF